MAQWWDSLSMLLKALHCVAVFSSAVLIIQTIQILFGFGEGGAAADFSDTSGLDLDTSFDTDGISDADAASFDDGTSLNDFDVLRLFSFQSIVAFLTLFSWMSIAFINSGTSIILSMTIGTAFGLVAMYGVAKMIQLSSKLVSDGNIVLKNALGQMGRVYIPIKSKGKEQGKVLITLQERLLEQDAITEGNCDLPSGTTVRVVDIRGNLLVVEKDD